jgi:hypothetical protein
MRFASILSASLLFHSTDALLKPKPKPGPSPPIPIINSTLTPLPPRHAELLVPTSLESDSFGLEIASNDLLTVITGDSSLSIYLTKKKHWNEIEAIHYSSKNKITSVSVCGGGSDLIALTLTENLCDDNEVDCVIQNPEIIFLSVSSGGKVTSIRSYGGSFLHNLLHPTADAVAPTSAPTSEATAASTSVPTTVSNSSNTSSPFSNASFSSSAASSSSWQQEVPMYLMRSLSLVCSGDTVLVTSSWRDLNATPLLETSFTAALGTRVSWGVFSEPQSSPPSFQFQKLDLSELIESQSIVSVAVKESNILIASLASPTSSSTPWAHFFSLVALSSPDSETSSSSTISYPSHLCSLPGNDEILSGTGSDTFAGLSTAISSSTAVLGLARLSEVYVFALDSQSAATDCVWKTVGILRASDSFLGDLFGAAPSSSPPLSLSHVPPSPSAGFSVFVSSSPSSESILVGAPQADSDDSLSGAVYLFQRRAEEGGGNRSLALSTQWLEEKIVSASSSDPYEETTQSAFGSRVYATSFALFFSAVPRLLVSSSSTSASTATTSAHTGQVYILWTDPRFSSSSLESDATNSSLWTSTLMWALVLVSIPVAIAMALVSYRYRDSASALCRPKSRPLLLPSSDSSSASSPFAPSPFLFTACVESESVAASPAPAAIIRLSPLMRYVLNPTPSSAPAPSASGASFSDVESNCSTSPGAAGRGGAGVRAGTSWNLSGRRDYRQLPVPDSPSCRSEVSALSLDQDPSANEEQLPPQEGWASRLSTLLKFGSLPPSSAVQDKPLRSSLQSPTPSLPPLHNPMLSPAVVE